MVRRSLLLVLLAGFSFADTGFKDTIQFTEADNSPKCMAGQVVVGNGQLTCAGNKATLTITGGGGGGGSSSLAVTAGPVRSSPTSDILFNPNQMSGSVSGSSITISLAASSVTLQGQNVIKLTSALQSASTFYVSSGTVSGPLAVIGQLTVGGPIVGNGAYLTNVPIMSPNSTAPFPGATPGSVEITQYFNSGSGLTNGYQVAGTQTLTRSGSTLIVGNSNAGSAGSTICIGDNACSNLDNSGVRSTIIGTAAGQFDMAEDNTCIGYNSCGDTIANQNSCFGAFSCASTSSGAGNTAMGWNTMPNATSAANNVCIGWNTCDLLTTGSENMAVGDLAAGDITTGVRNVCMGGGTDSVQACTGIVSGSSNTAVGNGSLGNISYVGNEWGNTTVGYNSAVGVGVNHAGAFGMNAVATSSYTIQMGGLGSDGMRVVMTTMTVSSGSVINQLTVGSLKTNSNVTFNDSDNSNFVALKSSAVVASNITYTLPALDQTGTMKSNGAGDLFISSNVGVFVSSIASAATSFPTSGQYGDSLSITVGPGDWDITGTINAANNSATVTTYAVGISTSSGNNSSVMIQGTDLLAFTPGVGTSNNSVSVPNVRRLVTITTTFYLKVVAVYTVATPVYVGRISARNWGNP